MNIQWSGPKRDPKARAQDSFAHVAQRLPLRHRVDAVLIRGVSFLLIFLVVLCFLIVQWLERTGRLDSPIVQPVADDRILTNFRTELAQKPLLDGVYHLPDQQLYLAQSGGTFHTYEPSTGLWSELRPFANNTTINHDFVTLRSGCGADARSAFRANCPEPETLWAVTAEGGLVRRIEDRWEILIPDSRFIGVDGVAVESDQLTTAALSGDGRWLVLGTRQSGIGVYDNSTRLWQHVDVALPSPSVSHLVWWRDRFWIGGPAGLASLLVSSRRSELQTVTAISGEILDLDARFDQTGNLWLMERHACSEGGDSCLRVVRVDQAAAEPSFTVMFDEQNRFDDLSMASLRFAQNWPNQLVVAGEAGIFTYDPRLHNWERHFDRAVEATLPLKDGNGFYFAFPGGAGLLPAGDDSAAGPITEWDVASERTTKLLYGINGEILLLMQSGNLYTLRDAPTVHALFQGTQTAFDPTTFTSAVANPTRVLLASPEGALLHDIVTRSYLDIDAADLPEWMANDDTRWLNSGTSVFALTGADQRNSRVYRFPTADFFTEEYLRQTIGDVTPVSVAGPIDLHWKWDANSIGTLSANGDVTRLNASRADPQIGAPEPELDELALLDVAIQSGDLVITTNRGLRVYDDDERSWSAFIDPPADARAEELTVYENRLLMRTDRNRLVQLTNANPLLIGDAKGFNIATESLSDATQLADKLYLAGAGQVEEYDLGLRRISERWQLGGDAEVALKAILANQPLALSQGRATIGDSTIDGDAGSVEALFVGDGALWTVRQASGEEYLKRYALNGATVGNARCFFRNPEAAPGATEIRDARRLADGVIAVATNRGLHFYSPSARAWFAGPENLDFAITRLYLLETHLLLVAQQASSTQLVLIPVSSILLPDSCSSERVSLQSSSEEVAAVAVDEENGQAAWIDSDRGLYEWQTGTTTQLLAAPSPAPEAAAIRRLYKRATYLLAITENSIWLYRLADHRWSEIQLRFAGSSPTLLDLNIEPSQSSESVTARAENGTFYVGHFTLPTTSVSMQRIASPPASTFGASGEALLDVQDDDAGYWTFVLNDRIKYYDPAARTWEPDVQIDAPAFSPDLSLTYRKAFERRVAVANDGTSWWIAQTTAVPPTRFARFDLPTDEMIAIDQGGDIWRLDGNGQLRQCSADNQNAYSCHNAWAGPVWLDPDAITAAYEWQNLILLANSAGLRAVVPATGEELTLPADAVGYAPIDEARRYFSQLWLRSRDRLLLLTKSATNQINARLLAGIEALIYDQTGQPWARFADGWQYWDDNDFALPAVRQPSPQPESMRVFAFEDAQVTALDPAGYPYYWQDNLARDSYPLPSVVTAAPITALFHGAQQDWWVVSGQRVHHVVRGTCYRQGVLPTATATPFPPTPTMTPIPPLTATVGTPTPTITPTVAFTPTPIPTPTPEPYPCLVLTRTADVPATVQIATEGAIRTGRMLEDGTLQLLMVNGTGIEITSQANAPYTVMPVNIVLSPADEVENGWLQLRDNAVQLDNGRWAYDPPTALRVGNTGTLSLVRPSRTNSLDVSATLQLQTPPALNVGWLRWNRTQSNFTVNTPSGPTAFAKTEFIINNELLFEPSNAILVHSTALVRVANSYGVWTYPDTDLDLLGDVEFQPVALALPITAAHNRFLAQNGDLTGGQSSITQSNSEYSFTLGDATFTEAMRPRTVSGVVTINGSPDQVFADNGLIWDTERRSIAYADGTLYLQSAAGIHPARATSQFDAGPAGLARSNSSVHAESGGLLHLVEGERWYRRSASAWQADVVDPTLDRTLVDDAIWQWSMVGGQIQIELAGTSHNFVHQVGDSGYTFTSDHLQAAAWHQNALFVATDAFWEIADNTDAIATLAANRISPVAVDLLENIPALQGGAGLFRTLNGVVTRWASTNQNFVAVADVDNPYLRQIVVDTSRLRFTRFSDSVLLELQVDEYAGSSDWVAFTLLDGQFPFDVVTSLAEYGDQLYVGSAAGLQLYNGLSTDWSDIDTLLDMRATATGPLDAVQRVGSPRAAPDRLMARSDGLCLERTQSQPFAPCSEPAALDWRMRGATSLWRWTQNSDAEIVGEYELADGSYVRPFAMLDAGRFPHDHITGVSICNGNAFVHWTNNWLTVHNDATLRLQAGLTTYNLDGTPQQLVCVESSVGLATGSAAPGLYAEMADGGLQRFDGSGWSVVDDADVVTDVREMADRPPILARERLRLVAPATGESLRFEQRTLNGAWLPLTWQTGRVAIDHWRAIAAVNGQLWVATPDGLVPLAVDGNQKVTLNPDALVIVREPQIEGNLCTITDMDVFADQLVARCNADSSTVFVGDLALTQNSMTQDSGIFQPAPNDPFVEQLLVETEYWRWRRTGRVGGSPGSLAAGWRREEEQEEVLRLAGGRFDFDTLTSLALFDPTADHIEVASQAGGWFQTSNDSWHVAEWQRPAVSAFDPAEIPTISIGYENDAFQLCLQSVEGDYLRLPTLLDEPQQVQNCLEYFGESGIWRYAGDGGALHIESPDSLGGVALRSMQNGRFADDQLLGLPITLQREAGRVYLLPTMAGVVEYDQEFSPQTIHAPDFPGLAGRTVPHALFVWDEGAPVYAANDALHRLDERATIVGSPFNTGFNGEPSAQAPALIRDGPYNLLYIEWRTDLEQGQEQGGNQRRWSMIDRNDPGVLLHQGVPVAVHTFDRYVQRRAEWGNPAPWLYVALHNSELSLSILGRQEERAVAYPTAFSPLAAIAVDERLYLVGKEELFEVDLNPAMVAAYQLTPQPTPTAMAQPTPIATETPPPSSAPTVEMILMPTPTPILGVVSTDGRDLNVRHLPNTSGNRPFANIDNGTSVVVMGISADGAWYKINAPSLPEAGWVAASLITISVPPESLPVLE